MSTAAAPPPFPSSPSASTASTVLLRPAHLSDHRTIARLCTRAFFNDILFGITIHPYRHRYPTDSDHYWLRRNIVAHFDWSHRFVVAVAHEAKTQGAERIVGIAHWSRIGLGNAENAAAGWGLRRWWDVRRLLRPVVEGLVWLVGKLGWRNRAADPALEGMVEASYGFIDPWDEGKERCPSLYLECLAVEPEFQGKGVGRMLVQHGLGLAEEAGISASVISADGKEEFYRKCGYDVGPVGRSGEGEGNPLWAVPGGMVFFREAPSKQSLEKERSAEVEEALRWLKKDNETGWPSVWLDAKAPM